MTPHSRRLLGDRGEELASAALESAGLAIVERNWRCASGELDIIARERGPDYSRAEADAEWLVVVEVRTRRGDRFGTASQSVTTRKQAKLRETAEQYVRATAWPGPWRIDVVAVQMDAAGHLLAVEHIRHAVAAA